MKLVVDNLSSTSGWSASGGSTTIHGLNDLNEFIAGNNSQSLILKFSGINSYCEKTLSTDVSNYDQVTLHIWSRNKKEQKYTKSSDFSYKIDFGSGKEFYLPAYETFHHMTIDISGISTLDRIRITALSGDIDYINISYLVVSTDEFPLDVFSAIKEQMEYLRDAREFDTLYNAGTASGTTGDKYIQFSSDVNWLQRYAVIKIDDGNNSEIHQIDQKEGTKFSFNDMYDGDSLVNDYTDANVYLYLPIEFGVTDSEIILPGTTIWGIVPERLYINTTLDYILDSFATDDTFKERQEGQFFKYSILIDCEARQQEIIEKLAEIVKICLGQDTIWVNGRKIHIEFDGVGTEIEQTEAHKIIPKLHFSAKVEIKEELYLRNTLYKFDTLSYTNTIQ